MSGQNKGVVRKSYADFDKNPAPLDETLAPNFVAHAPGAPAPMNRDAFKQFAAALRTGFPDLRHTIDDIMAEGDKVATRFTARGTHLAPFQGIPPTGKQVVFTGMIVDRVSGGKIVEKWFEFDAVGLMQQLGVIPAPR